MFTREWIVTSSSLTTCFHSFVQLYFGHNDILPTSFSAQNTLTRYYIYSPVVRIHCLHTISAATYRIEMKIKKAPNCNLSTKERQELGRTPALFLATKLWVFNETSGQFTALFLTRCRDDLQPYLRQPKQVFWAKTRSFSQPWPNVFSACWAFRNKVTTFQWFCSICKVDKQYVNKSKYDPKKSSWNTNSWQIKTPVRKHIILCCM